MVQSNGPKAKKKSTTGGAGFGSARRTGGSARRTGQASSDSQTEPSSTTKSSRRTVADDDNSRNSSAESATPPLSVPDQQRLLNHFTTAFASVLHDEDLPRRLQAIKQALFRRDFATAFGRADYLDAYAARWSPTRALCYAAIFRHHLRPHLSSSSSSSDGDGVRDSAAVEPEPGRRVKMVCIGGCAAEHVAFASYLNDCSAQQQQQGALTLLDSGPWSGVADKIQGALTAPLPLSQYASAAAQAANTPLLTTPTQLTLQILQQDALDAAEAEWADIILTPAAAADNADTVTVVTLLFTLNELYTNGGIAKTTRFLKTLGAALPDGALLLVVDSPGSYSEAALGKEKKKYPMQWLLHHTLTETEADAPRWTRLQTHDSLWFRLSDQLSYPIPLENMRYQLHLYKVHKAT